MIERGIAETSQEPHVPQRAWVRAYRIIFALLTLAAVVYQFSVQNERVDFVPENFFSFFTIQSNVIAALLFLLLAMGRSVLSSVLDLFRGGVVTYMLLTGVVYGLLLSGYEDALQTPEPWVNTVLHQVIPLIVVLDWFIQPPRSRITFAQALVWPVYPMLYLAYTLTRGPRVDWYPYPFLDPRLEGGYPVVLATCAAIMVGFLIATWMLVAISQRLRIRIEVRR